MGGVQPSGGCGLVLVEASVFSLAVAITIKCIAHVGFLVRPARLERIDDVGVVADSRLNLVWSLLWATTLT